MQSISEQSDRAMGLVKAAHSSWKNSTGSETEAEELHQEYEARLAELATPWVSSGRIPRPAALSLQGAGRRRGVQSGLLSVRPSRSGEHPCLHPGAVKQFDSRLQLRSGTPARRMLRYKKVGLARIRVYTLRRNELLHRAQKVYYVESDVHDPAGRVRGESFLIKLTRFAC